MNILGPYNSLSLTATVNVRLIAGISTTNAFTTTAATATSPGAATATATSSTLATLTTPGLVRLTAARQRPTTDGSTREEGIGRSRRSFWTIGTDGSNLAVVKGLSIFGSSIIFGTVTS